MLVSALLAAALAVPQAQARPRVRASRSEHVATPPRLEDFLTGERRGGGFRRRVPPAEPQDLTPATERTETDASRMTTRTCTSRSSAMRWIVRVSAPGCRGGSDLQRRLCRRLSRHVQRSSAGLRVSRLAARHPAGRHLTEGQGDDFSFDTIWNTRGRLTGFGYVVWMAIPFRSLRFPPAAGPHTWGIGFIRVIPVKSENVFWPAITRRISSFTNQFADLHGLEGVSPGRNIQLTPYGTFTGRDFSIAACRPTTPSGTAAWASTRRSSRAIRHVRLHAQP